MNGREGRIPEHCSRLPQVSVSRQAVTRDLSFGTGDPFNVSPRAQESAPPTPASLSGGDSTETLRITRRLAGGDSLNGSNARLCQLKGPIRIDGQTSTDEPCLWLLATERPSVKSPAELSVTD